MHDFPMTPDGRRLLCEKDAAKYIGVSVSFLRKSRCHGTSAGHTQAPPFIKLPGRIVRYDIKDLDAWIEKHRTDVKPSWE